MRPIKLKIKGLNSFIDEQEIDFNKLCERGFFGIFGPTGSGKSTILDGITLALYGDLPRKSTNYINVNCNSLNVSFEFSISDGKTKVYRVEREFKTDKKTGRPKSGKCKVLDITIKPIILAESVKEVTKTCENIIGLSLNDFTKTVVLPQGSFSEFLKISGKDKREMLERLFNLEEYGENLEKKLFAKGKIIEKELDVIKGQLSGYETINIDDLKVKENEFDNNEKYINKKSLELLGINKSYEEAKEVFQLKSELEGYINEKNITVMQEEDIKNKRVKIDNIEKSLKVLKFIENYNKVLKELTEASKNLEGYEIKFKDIKNKKDNILKVYNEFLEKKQDTVPRLNIKAERLDREIENRKVLIALEEEIVKLTEIIRLLKINKQKKINEVDKIQEAVRGIKLDIKVLEEEYDLLKVDRNLKKEIEDAIRLEKDYIYVSNCIDESSRDIEVLQDNIRLYEGNKRNLERDRDKNLEKLKKYEKLLEILEINYPEKDEDLLSKKILLQNMKENKKKFDSYKEKIDLNNSDILKIKESLDKLRKEKSNITNTINLLEKEIDGLETESLALKVREKLKSGDICPVCGSTHHNRENVKILDLDLLKDKSTNLSKNKDLLLEKEKEIAKLEERLEVKSNKIKDFENEIRSLGEEFKENKIYKLEEEIKNLEESIEEYKRKKIDLEGKLNFMRDTHRDLDGDIRILDANLKNYEMDLNKKVKKTEEDLEKFSFLKNSIEEKRTSLRIVNFNEKYEELIRKENKREEVERKIKDKRYIKEDKEEERDIRNREKEVLVNDLTSKESSLREKENQRKNIVDNLQQEFKILGDLKNLEKALADTNTEIKSIDEYFNRYNKQKAYMEEEFEKINNKLSKENLNVKVLKDKEKLSKQELENSLKEEKFVNIEEVKEFLKERHILESLKICVENYEEKIKVLWININSVLKKLNNRNITKEDFERIKSNKEEIQCELDSLKNINLILKQEINILKDKIERFKEIINKKKKIEDNENMINDLKRLFSGKKFVDYVATERLKYVALEASKRLKEITSGAYSLEVNKDGKFIIRDFKNGGSIREVSTLSGGETFLTSLALALSLSTGLQLKKTAPLELFFLDEGFGTLDDDLLETVISSLERIHHEKLKIGIISHVESIKNRVPVKLIVTPAESGMGGSKVKIEKN